MPGDLFNRILKVSQRVALLGSGIITSGMHVKPLRTLPHFLLGESVIGILAGIH